MTHAKSTALVSNVIFNGLQVLCGILTGVFLTPLLIGYFGVDGFGLFCTIGASGVLFSIFTSTVNNSVSRELAFSIGAKNKNLRKVFSTVFCLQFLMAAVFTASFVAMISMMIKTIQIPVGWERTCQICLYVIAFQFGITILISPFRAIFYAHQQHRFLALIGILSNVTRFMSLGFIFLFPGFNPLLVYVCGNFLLSLPILLTIPVFAFRKFPESHPTIRDFDWTILKSVFKYASSAFIMTLSYQLRSQGLVLFFNIFFGNAVAAAQGISIRVNNVIRSGVGVFTTTIQPAITTSTASKDRATSFRLANLNSALSSLAAVVLTVPFLLDAEVILASWLKTYPEFSPVFVRIACLSIVTTMMSYGHASAMHADGRIGRYAIATQAIIGGMSLIAIGFVIYYELQPWVVLAGETIGLTIVACTLQLLWPKYLLGFPIRSWLRDALMPTAVMLFVSVATAFVAMQFFVPSLGRAVAVGFAAVVSAGVIAFLIVLRRNERLQVKRIFTAQLKRLFSIQPAI